MRGESLMHTWSCASICIVLSVLLVAIAYNSFDEQMYAHKKGGGVSGWGNGSGWQQLLKCP